MKLENCIWCENEFRYCSCQHSILEDPLVWELAIDPSLGELSIFRDGDLQVRGVDYIIDGRKVIFHRQKVNKGDRLAAIFESKATTTGLETRIKYGLQRIILQ